MFKKLVILSSALTWAMTVGAQASDLNEHRECREGTVYVNGHVLLDSAGKPVRCGVIGPVVDGGVDPMLLAAGAAVVAGGVVAVVVSNKSKPASP